MLIDACVTLGEERDTVYSADDLVRDLDAAGVDMAVAAPADRETAVHNRRGNDFIIEQASAWPDRIVPACTVNPWFGEDAIEEFTRAAEWGARMLVLHPTLQGFLVNDTLADPLMERAGTLGLPVYVHTGAHLYGAPWQLIDCALRFPSVDFIMGHAGSTDYWNDVPYAGAFAPNVYLEGSNARPFSFRSHIESVGADKGIMGSAAPRNSLVFEWEQYRKCMSDDSFAPVFGENCAVLLGLREGGP